MNLGIKSKFVKTQSLVLYYSQLLTNQIINYLGMQSALSRPTLTLSLTPMQSDEAVASSFTLKSSKNDDVIGNSLLLHPGINGEMFVVIENLGDYPQTVKLEIEGDFNSDWCHYKSEDLSLIAPHSKIERTIAFLVPINFFENQQALVESPQLQINYISQIYVYTYTENTQQLVEYQTFNIIVRPKNSYLDFLPTLFREVDFLGRFLTIMEQAFDPAVQTIENLWAYLDPITAPIALLPFLAHWVGWDMDTHNSIEVQRRLIRNAITLYRWHGTEFGLRFYLHLYTGLPLEQIYIREIFEQGFVLGPTCIGSDSMLGGGRPYHFVVELHPFEQNQIDEAMVRDIIERQKPPFCTYDLDIINF